MNLNTMTQNRKRSRNLYEDDASEFMPLSKRINNLHINTAFPIPTDAVYLKPNEWGPGPPVVYNLTPEPDTSEILNSQQHEWNENTSQQQPVSPALPPQYNPELSESQNPYYFNNKLLFDLFVERMQRNGHNFN